jgi:hypothetical protein
MLLEFPKNAEHLLKKFFNISSEDSLCPTFLEIAGYPHYENVCSNILSFYFDPFANHGLGDLLLKCLFEPSEYSPEYSANTTVEREVCTASKKRIDILVETETHIIGVENKIWHSINNPFDDYYKHLMDMNGEKEKTILMFILGVNVNESHTTKNLKVLSYHTFFQRIRSEIGERLSFANQKYLPFFLDFMTSMQNLNEKSGCGKELLEFIKENGKELARMIKTANDFKKELKAKVKALGSIIQVNDSQIKQWFFTSSDADFFYILVHDIALSNGMIIAVDTTVTASGWKIEIFIRKNGSKKILQKILSNDKIDCIDIEREYGHRFVYKTRFDYFEKQEVIQKHLQNILDKISKADVYKIDVDEDFS